MACRGTKDSDVIFTYTMTRSLHPAAGYFGVMAEGLSTFAPAVHAAAGGMQLGLAAAARGLQKMS